MTPEIEPFEQRLGRQPVKPVPAAWRAEILAAARAAQPAAGTARPSPASWLASLFWPYPRACAGLAAVWGFIFLLHFSLREAPPTLAQTAPAPAPSPEAVAELRQQQKLYAELMDAPGPREADRPRLAAPKPRSQRWDVAAA